jgi:hypothetical protein
MLRSTRYIQQRHIKAVKKIRMDKLMQRAGVPYPTVIGNPFFSSDWVPAALFYLHDHDAVHLQTASTTGNAPGSEKFLRGFPIIEKFHFSPTARPDRLAEGKNLFSCKKD